MNARIRIAWNLRQIRSNQGITQENLAVDANVDRTAISGIETGDYKPTIDLLERLAEALSIDIVDLVSKVPDGAQAPRPMRAGRKPKRS